MDDALTLYQIKYTMDSIGNQIPVRMPHEVYARVESVGRSDWAEGGRIGLKPEIKAVLCLFDYEGEQEADYKGERYSVYRTYSPSDSDRIELYLTERSGVNGDD